MQLLNNAVNLTGYGYDTFYNPKISSIGFNLSLSKGTLQIKIAKSLDPTVNPSKIAKGQKMYDNENASNFSLKPTECVGLYSALTAMRDNSYINKSARNDQEKYSYIITHFSNDNPSILTVKRSDNGVSIAIYQNKVNVYYSFR